MASRLVQLALVAAVVGGCGTAADQAAGGVAGFTAAGGPVNCDLVASPGGRAGADGTAGDPLRGAQSLADRLRPGQTGCLRGGTYDRSGGDGYALRVNHGGNRGKRITLRSFPGERAKLAGVVSIPQGSDDVRLSHLDVDDPTSFQQAGQITVQINAKRAILDHVTITNGNRKSCVQLGTGKGWGTAVSPVISDSRLFRCGDPGNGMRDHAIYAGNVRGGKIVRNVIWGTGGWGVHLYPNTVGMTVARNVIVDNGGGVVIAGEGDVASARNRVVDNVIADSRRGASLDTYWGGRVGRGNVVRGNCLSGDGGIGATTGLRMGVNATVDARFANAGARDYRLTSPCRGAAKAASAVAGLGG